MTLNSTGMEQYSCAGSACEITVVEFFGMTATGKTTIARIVRDSLAQVGVQTVFHAVIDDWIINDCWKTVANRGRPMSPIDLLAALRVGWRAVRLAASMRPWSWSHLHRARQLTGWYRRTRYLARSKQCELAIQDEGVLHTVMHMVMHGFAYSEKQLKTLTACIAEEPYRIFVYVRTDRETVRKRRRERSKLQPGEPAKLWRHEEADENQEHQIQHELEVLFDRMDDAIESVAANRKLVVTNDQSAEEAARLVLAFIRRVCR